MQQKSSDHAGQPDIRHPISSRAEGERAMRRERREEQRLVDHARLLRHQALAGDLLKMSAKQQEHVIGSARAEIIRWRRGRLCSRDYADRWDELLDLPVTELAEAISSKSMSWGAALRRNAPFMFGQEAEPQEQP